MLKELNYKFYYNNSNFYNNEKIFKTNKLMCFNLKILNLMKNICIIIIIIINI